MELSLKLSKEEQDVINNYIKREGITLTEAFKEALLEKIEEIEDIKAGDEAYEEYLRDGKTYTHEEVMKIFGV